jgi:hypothetical protein
MGMDVSGRSPKTKAGEYFRANCWSWRPLHELMYKLGGDIIDAHTMNGMGFNDGEGIKTQAVCTLLADRFAIWLEQNTSGYSTDEGCHVLKGTGRFASDEDMCNPEVATETAHSIEDSHIQEFTEFLRDCGGFMVY